ncbi:MAG: hypothetical protein ACRD2A_26000 [Vicinamibacterales bacterium]
MRSSQSLDRLSVTADDEHLIASAGLLLPATLAQHLGLAALVRTHVDLGAARGRANVDHKALTLIHSMLAGGDSIDDADALRARRARHDPGKRKRRRGGRCEVEPTPADPRDIRQPLTGSFDLGFLSPRVDMLGAIPSEGGGHEMAHRKGRK